MLRAAKIFRWERELRSVVGEESMIANRELRYDTGLWEM